MFRAIVVKELREIRAIAGLAAAIFVVITVWLTGWLGPEDERRLNYEGPSLSDREYLIMDEMVLLFFGFAWGALAIGLGLRQSAWEGMKGTWLFLLHRPVSRETVLFAKMLTGLAVYLLVSAIPIVLSALWWAQPGNVTFPFEWSMTSDALRVCVVIGIVYFGGFLSGIRQAKWYTAFFPLAFCIVIVMALAAPPWRWYVWFPLVGGLWALLAANICYVARIRNYS